MNIRERFEEIWPVPDGVRWHKSLGRYEPKFYNYQTIPACDFHNIRLDTFTRCQETTDVYVSLVSELVASIERAEILICNIDAPTTGSGYSELIDWTEYETAPILRRARKIIGRE